MKAYPYPAYNNSNLEIWIYNNLNLFVLIWVMAVETIKYKFFTFWLNNNYENNYYYIFFEK